MKYTLFCRPGRNFSPGLHYLVLGSWIASDENTVILAHGIRSKNTTLKHVKSAIEDLGLPVHTFSFSNNGNDGISSGAAQLTREVSQKRADWKVDTVNIVAHSMGGLKAREYVEKYGNPKTHKTDVMKVIQIATPNGGSPLANLGVSLRLQAESFAREHPIQAAVIKAKYGDMYYAISGCMHFDIFTDRALDELTTNYMSEYNKYHKLNNNVDFSIIAGDVVLRNTMGFAEKKMFDYVYSHSGANDTVVSVSSAHAIPMKNNWTASGSSDISSHSGLVEDGARTMISLAKNELLTRKYPITEQSEGERANTRARRISTTSFATPEDSKQTGESIICDIAESGRQRDGISCGIRWY